MVAAKTVVYSCLRISKTLGAWCIVRGASLPAALLETGDRAMTSQERQFYTAILFNACRFRREMNNSPDNVNFSFIHLHGAINHIAAHLARPRFTMVR